MKPPLYRLGSTRGLIHRHLSRDNEKAAQIGGLCF